jgi:hypothetical protein
MEAITLDGVVGNARCPAEIDARGFDWTQTIGVGRPN